MPTHYEGTPDEARALDAWTKLARATDSVGGRLLGRASFGELTPRQFGVLEALYHLGPMRPGQLSAKLLKSGGNITLVVDNLARDGLVQRQRDSDDRRVVVVSLTEKGQQRISRIFPRHVADILTEMSILTAEEQETLSRLCRILGTQERK